MFYQTNNVWVLQFYSESAWKDLEKSVNLKFKTVWEP